MNDTPEYLEKKKFFDRILTIFGRKPVLEALTDSRIDCFRLHLADSNKPVPIIEEILALAEKRQIEIAYHSRQALSRISRNGKQDQGVALDLQLKGFTSSEEFLEDNTNKDFELIALDKITNPQNLGMIVRSVCASPTAGILLPKKGCATLDSLVIKASAGTLFKAKIIRCDSLESGIKQCKKHGAEIIGLDANAQLKINSLKEPKARVFVLGNETEGVSKSIRSLCDTMVSIPMQNQVESLNVAVTASLLAFRSLM